MGTYQDPDCDIPLMTLARRSDPPTSKAAAAVAEQEFAATHEERILAALVVGPGTKDQLAARCRLSEQQVIRRMAALKRDGKVREVGVAVSPSGFQETVWGMA